MRYDVTSMSHAQQQVVTRRTFLGAIAVAVPALGSAFSLCRFDPVIAEAVLTSASLGEEMMRSVLRRSGQAVFFRGVQLPEIAPNRFRREEGRAEVEVECYWSDDAQTFYLRSYRLSEPRCRA